MNRKMRINFKDGEHTDLKISKAAVSSLIFLTIFYLLTSLITIFIIDIIETVKL